MAVLNYGAHGGVHVLGSVVREALSFEDQEFHKREATLIANRNATPEDFLEVIQTMREGLVATETLLTHRARLEDSPERFPVWIAPRSGVIKGIRD